MFANIANVLCIREALWRHKMLGSASIMVGAGFSRNADPLSSTARVMPGWSEMAEALCHPLYPSDDARRRTALRDASGTSGFLRLAQEYQAAFGASSLNDRIRSLVSDTDYRPGDLHKRLLRLPWADVFSTNWDTLLERACADVFDRSYDIVHTAGQIPFTMRPRIVKLHGSFPSHEPFIFTEEEYRTYPLRFSPFVNLVQQSMMETIFCLIGFSCDDPNFLHWSGWVRDNLGPGAPKIFLVGWLELSVHRRRMLEARSVMPVDLSTLPGAEKWPPDLRHRYATEWFISAMELGKPYGATYWPSPPSPPPAPPHHLGMVPANTQPLPKSEPHSPPWGRPAAEREQSLRVTIQIWAENRRLYPGWLIAPERVRETLRRHLSAWISEFSLLPGLSALDRLKALSELAWRTERALLPFPSDQEAAAYSALTAIDRSARTIGGEQLPEAENWSEILIGVDTLALVLARSARHAGNRTRFDQAISFLTLQREHRAELSNALAYEECLWDLATGDLSSLLTRLDKWIPADVETLWSLRKAGLLAEMQEHVRACALLEAALVQVRRARRRDVDDLVSLSLEGWALYLALAYSDWVPRRSPTLSKDMPEPFERWRALEIVDCNAFSDYHALRRVLEANKLQQSEITKTRGFDLGHSSVTHHLAPGPSPSAIAAYQMVMLAEITGIPPKANHMNLLGDGLKGAAKILSADEPWLSSQFAIRIEPNDSFLEEVFSRAHIARLPERLVGMLRDALLRRIAFGLARVARQDSDRGDLSMVSSALEVLSRVAVRLSPDDLRRLFEEATPYYRSPIFRRLSTFLGLPLSHLLARILESLPGSDILELLPRLFALPLPREVGSTGDEDRWSDPARLLPDWFDCTLEPAPGPRAPEWEGIISHLLIITRGVDVVDRGAAVSRLFQLLGWGILGEEERRAFATALWAPAQRDAFGLPQHTNLRPWVLLVMPEEQVGQAKATLLHFIAQLSRQGNVERYTSLAEIGEILSHFLRLEIPIELSTEVQADLIALIDSWAAHRAQIRHPFERFGGRDRRELEAVQGVAAISHYIPVSEELLGKIWDKAAAMDAGRDGEVPAFPVYPLLVERKPDRTEELLDRLRRALISDREDAVQAAVHGIYVWISALERASQSPNPELDDLVRELGIGIAARRLVLLSPALDLARWVFSKGPERLRHLIVRDCDHGLTALLEETSYSRSDLPFDVPAVRAACLRLARAMASAAYAQHRGVIGWLTAAKDDPLPEVRNAEDRKSI
jgi:hypothetical protein